MPESFDAENQVIGAATCDECRARIKVLEKNRSLIGKAVRCPKCRTLFTLALEIPSNAEQSAIAAEEERTKDTKRKKRTQDEIRSGHIEKALAGFKSLHGRLQNLAQEAGNKEEQVRIWCVDALRTALGYDDDEIETERKVLNGRIDIAIKKDGRVMTVIECKAIRSRLGASVLDQAGTYAATLSASWMVLTNGDIWKLYRVTSPAMDTNQPWNWFLTLHFWMTTALVIGTQRTCIC